MRRAMAEAVLGGDDCYGDDPSVRELEERVAARLGQEKPRSFVPSGTMSNQLAVHTHCKPGRVHRPRPALSHVQLHEDGLRRRCCRGLTVEGLGGSCAPLRARPTCV